MAPVYALWGSSPWQTASLVASSTVALAATIALRHARAHEPVAALAIVAIFALTAAAAWFSGGARSEVILWLFVFPGIGHRTVNARFALVLASLAVAVETLYFAAELNGAAQSHAPSALLLLQSAAVVAYLTGYSILTDRGRERALLEAGGAVRELQRRESELTFAISLIENESDARRRAETSLRLAQKLEAIGQLAAGVAHEINTPVQFVSDSVAYVKEASEQLLRLIAAYKQSFEGIVRGPETGASLAQAEQDADLAFHQESLGPAIARASDGLDRIAAIVRAMKDFAHVGDAERAAGDINRAVESTVVIAANECRYVADVQTDLAADLPSVVCNLGEVKQVILNLVVNAAHAVGDVVKNTGGRGRIRIGTRRDGDGVVLSVSDTGGGIPDGIRERVFEPFFTTKEVGRGTGQGLAIARSVANNHGGSLDFETEIGRGTTFFLRLPIRAATEELGAGSTGERPAAA